MAPPGIALVSLSHAAWDRQAQARSPRFYFDWTQAQKLAAKGATPWTPAVSVMFALREGIRMLLEEGLDAVYRRHREIADACMAGLEGMGFRPLAAPGYRSATISAVTTPEALDVKAYRQLLREKFGVVIAGGQGKLEGRLLRVGHLGAVSAGDMVQVLWAMEQALEELDVRPNQGAGVAAATRALSEASATPATV
jgi:aspartate aminotransferase-like enzyme